MDPRHVPRTLTSIAESRYDGYGIPIGWPSIFAGEHNQVILVPNRELPKKKGVVDP